MPKKISDEDKALFREAVKTAKPLKKSNIIEPDSLIKINKTPPNSHVKIQKTTKSIKPEKASIYLSNYYTQEVQAQTLLSFCRDNLPAKRLRELKLGKIPRQAKLDLHGFKSDLAQQILIDFIQQAINFEHRCLLIIHGKGSPHGELPVLKNLVNHWLKQIPAVIAFHSALPQDGGTGALYVLLKKNRVR
ncbi:Smr domain protein, DNA mismatch repair protein-like protein [Legionella busanensis]|uniref:Smr domain protein, DNA mismatch repair protein-like protein n=1 Tax=Legionella busanensis TaxID=190655 RepID=A0A378JMI5_9GAMM|nr:Smr/MutS family protein [Legionella busanensis]STX52277.1 Smr domain protein, DNA mismatch repair protein-like protein [Legionella busanensis]